MTWDFILEGKNRTEHRPGVGDQGWGLTTGKQNVEYNQNEWVVRSDKGNKGHEAVGCYD